jgi:hypothetical protein
MTATIEKVVLYYSCDHAGSTKRGWCYAVHTVDAEGIADCDNSTIRNSERMSFAEAEMALRAEMGRGGLAGQDFSVENGGDESCELCREWRHGR